MTAEVHYDGVIVVGVDGSPASMRAMRWALTEARLRGSAVEVVTVWQPGSSVGPDTPSAAQEIQRRVLRDAVSEAEAQAEDAPLISEEVETGPAEEVLVRRSERASLLVVGSHGVGSVRHGALGSTSDYCSRMSACPVVVLPIPAEKPAPADLAASAR